VRQQTRSLRSLAAPGSGYGASSHETPPLRAGCLLTHPALRFGGVSRHPALRYGGLWLASPPPPPSALIGRGQACAQPPPFLSATARKEHSNEARSLRSLAAPGSGYGASSHETPPLRAGCLLTHPALRFGGVSRHPALRYGGLWLASPPPPPSALIGRGQACAQPPPFLSATARKEHSYKLPR